jgi:hypothetical protein
MEIGRVSFLEWDLIDSKNNQFKKGQASIFKCKDCSFFGGSAEIIWKCPFTKGTSSIKIRTKILKGNEQVIHF